MTRKYFIFNIISQILLFPYCTYICDIYIFKNNSQSLGYIIICVFKMYYFFWESGSIVFFFFLFALYLRLFYFIYSALFSHTQLFQGITSQGSCLVLFRVLYAVLGIKSCLTILKSSTLHTIFPVEKLLFILKHLSCSTHKRKSINILQTYNRGKMRAK